MQSENSGNSFQIVFLGLSATGYKISLLAYTSFTFVTQYNLYKLNVFDLDSIKNISFFPSEFNAWPNIPFASVQVNITNDIFITQEKNKRKL